MKTAALNSFAKRLYRHRMRLLRFGVVGIGGLLSDVGLFNVLRFAGGHGPLYEQPLTAKVISTSAGILVSWLGHRYWTFRGRNLKSIHRELASFLVVSVIGLAVSVAPLAVSYYVLGLRGALADNISANVVGLGLATAFRYWAMHKYVFLPPKPEPRRLPQQRVAAGSTSSTPTGMTGLPT